MSFKFIFTLAVVSGLSFSQLNAQQTAKITSSGIGFLEYLPQGYNTNNNNYPIVIFLHGIGEKGTTSTDPATLLSSVQKVANVGLAKYIKYGAQYPFIMIAPQLKSSYGLWPADYVIDVLNYVKKYLRIDERRIYITGLSLGGFGTWTTLAAYPQLFAASVPICSGGNALSKACAIAAENVPLWAFHGTSDNTVSYTVTTKMIDAVNACTPKPNPLAKYTLFPGMSHFIWDKVYKETNALSWMLSFTNGSSSTTTSNTAPVVSAGGDKSITLPTNEVYLQGTCSDADGSIASYKWTKTSGGAASLSGATTAKLRAYNLVEGTYGFRLTAQDNDGATKYDDVKVTVSASSTTNIAPVANAGPDLPTSSKSITLNGSGTDKDGRIVSYQWIKYYGGNVTLTNANSPNVTVSGMTDGKYFLRLTVTDDKGATDYDNMQIVVSGSGTSTTTNTSTSTTTSTSTANIAPVADAGPDLPTSSKSITLNGSGTDKDGRIVSYQWIKYYGGNVTLTNANSPNVTVSGMTDGKYFLRLTVTDDKGATDYDNMQIVVSGSGTSSSTTTTSNIAPVANAGPDKSITSTSLTLYGSGTDKDGSIVSYKWIQYGGAAATLTNANSPNLSVSGLKSGKYYFRLTVTDDRGASDYDNILVVVSTSSTASTTDSNLPPVANAGPDKRVANINTLNVYGSATDKDGKIVSYKWTQYGGDPVTLKNATSPNVTVGNLDPGKYYLKLIVKDNDGATDYDRMLIVVNES